jgi:uncharacterized MAPEG superfamily protein
MNAQSWLVATLALTAAMWVPYVLDRFVRLGILRTLGNPRPGDPDEQSAWAMRARRAHGNAVENLAVFAPLVLLAVRDGSGGTPAVVYACATYCVARLVHFVAFAAGVPVVRTVAFVAGFGAQVALVMHLLQA